MKGEKQIYEFGAFLLDTGEKQLRRTSGEVLPLPPKAFDLLCFLVENNGRLLDKNELLDGVWADSFVEEGNLKLNIHTLRKALDESGENFIETVPRRGYRFNADVRLLKSGELIVEKITQAKLVIEETDETEKLPQLARHGKTKSYTRFALLLMTIFAVGGLAYLVFLRPKPAASKTDAANIIVSNKSTTIAVLPFKNLTKDKQDEFLSVGLTDALITRLSAIHSFAVRPTSAVLPFAENVSPQLASEKLQVENILEGTIQRAGKRLKISVQLVQMPENKVLWAKSLEEDATDLLKIQDSIAVDIANSLLINLSQEEQTLLAKTQTQNSEAFQFYLKGRYFWNKRTTEDLRKSIELFNQAKEKDPNYSLAYVGLADAYQLLAEYNGMPAAEAIENSRNASRKALEINESSAEAHTSLAYTLAFYDWNWQEAEKEFRRAIELNPNYATARQWFGEYLTTFGKFDEAFAETKKAEALDPTSPIIQTDLAGIFYLTRQYDKAIEQTNKILELAPKFAYAYSYQWLAYEQKGQPDKAFESIIKLDSLFYPPEIINLERDAYQTGNWQGLWRLKFELTKQPAVDKFLNNYIKALTAIRAGENEETFAFLEKSAEARERWFVNLKYDPQWDSIRSDVRFAELVRKANLAP